MTLRKALVQSLNVPTVKLLEKVGVDETVRYARKLGVKSPLQPYLSWPSGVPTLRSWN